MERGVPTANQGKQTQDQTGRTTFVEDCSADESSSLSHSACYRPFSVRMCPVATGKQASMNVSADDWHPIGRMARTLHVCQVSVFNL